MIVQCFVSRNVNSLNDGLHLTFKLESKATTMEKFVCFGSLRPSQHIIKHVGMGLPGLKQY